MITRATVAGCELQLPNNSIADDLLSVAAVETVYVDENRQSVSVWTIVDDPAECVYDQIYDAERSIIKKFKSVQFDFWWCRGRAGIRDLLFR
jgi:hypothetical protein